MPKCKPTLGLRHTGARTTARRDHCRRKANQRHLHRGGRPRSSAWWRAWIYRLLAMDEPAPPPPQPPIPVSAQYDAQSDLLTINFDAPLDPESTAAAAQFSYGTTLERYPGSGNVEVIGSFVRVTVATPLAVPFGSGAWYAAGVGALLGINGAAVSPFGPV